MEFELDLMKRIKHDWGERIAVACVSDPVSNPQPPTPAFLAALISLESNGQRYAQRFEPAVWKHLHDVAGGKVAAYGVVDLEGIQRELKEIAKTADYHRSHLDAVWAEHHASILADGQDAAIRQMAMSWGLGQVMGYHTLDWPDVQPTDLLDGEINLRVSVRLLGEFVKRWHLELPRQEAELLRCWNTGNPSDSHPTFDPNYIGNGLRRLRVYEGLL